MSQSMKALKAMIEEGISGKEAAERYGISPAAVSKAKRYPSEIEQLRQRVAELERERVDCGKLGLDLCEQFKQLTAERDALKQQRDELLAALENTHNALKCFWPEGHVDAVAAIASVKEK